MFLAAKSFATAVQKLTPAIKGSPGLQLPTSFLAGFAFELSLKAVISRSGGPDGELKVLGHDLREAFREALRCGYKPPEGFGIRECIEVMADAHHELGYRYIAPEVEQIQTAKPDKLSIALKGHFDAIEQQFDVWGKGASSGG